MNSPAFLVLIVLFMGGLLFMSSRSRKKQQAQQDDLQNSLAVGDVVVMTSGISGTIVDLEDERTLDLEIAPDVVTTWLRQAVREKLSATETSDVPETVGELDAAEPADPSVAEAEPAPAREADRPTTTATTTTTDATTTAPGSRDDAVSPSLRKSGS